MHIAVLILNMILMINLLIAIMSDTYASLSTVRNGLYLKMVIWEMPKLAYDSQYGVLSMVPYPLSWLGLLALPFLFFIKDRETVKTINSVCQNIVFLPISLCLLAIFMIVNLVLIPLAYVKTAVHKFLLLIRFHNTLYCQ